ncbi:MAG: hypothetical protein AAB288_00750 [Acidobacteriota bacterium]
METSIRRLAEMASACPPTFFLSAFGYKSLAVAGISYDQTRRLSFNPKAVMVYFRLVPAIMVEFPARQSLKEDL